MVGGLGICGRPFCCASFLDDFQPVSIKMAKTQNLSLNPTKISGTCGRLMCCLKYEQDAYEDLIRSSPKAESFVDTPEGRGTVVDVNLLRQRVSVRMEDDPNTISVFQNSEIAVLRSGKAKKNDPPIPQDLAPISGGGKRPRKEEDPQTIHLEPIRFRYSTETIADEQDSPAVEQNPEATQDSRPPRNRNRRRRNEADKAAEAPKSQPAREVPKESAPKAGEKEAQNKRPRRKNGGRRRPTKQTGEA